MTTTRYQGKVTRIRFAGGDDGFMIVEVQSESGKRSSLVGILHDAVPGTLVECDVVHDHHPKFGEQLKAVGAVITSPPADKNGAVIFISGCPGVSEMKARAITDQIAEGLWDAVANASPRVAAIIGDDMAHNLADWYRANESLKEARIKLADWGLNRRQVTNAVSKWRTKTIETVEANPWILAEDIDGVGWKTADIIAQKLRRPMQCVERARAAALSMLSDAAQEGHAFCDRDALIKSCGNVMGLQARYVDDAIDELATDRKVVLSDNLADDDGFDVVYRASLFAAETGIARMVAALLTGDEPAEDDPTETDHDYETTTNDDGGDK